MIMRSHRDRAVIDYTWADKGGRAEVARTSIDMIGHAKSHRCAAVERRLPAMVVVHIRLIWATTSAACI